MKHIIIGTAGHVDHGKTALIRALTGIDTDRLSEEKKRGITIELGFAHVEWPDGTQAGIVDVPGHEKFIRNMLAGAGGIDLAMLIVAADEGFMPQTVEHLDILSLLGIRDGLVVLTKTDLVEPDWLEMMKEEVAERVKGTFLEGKPILPVSANTGAGIPELKDALYELILHAGEKSTRVPFRLPVDRVFSVDGFGTVVTGTLIEGCVRENDAAEIAPDGTETKIRNLQVHGSNVKTAYAGQRVAINLASVKKADVKRGDVICRPGTVHTSLMIDTKLSVLSDSKRSIRSNSQIHLYHGASEFLAKAVLLDREELHAGESCFAQLRLTEPLSCKNGDRFVVRFYSPLETIGGGVILDANPQKHKRNVPAVLEALRIRESGSDGDRIVQALGEFGTELPDSAALSKKAGMQPEELEQVLSELSETGRIAEPLPGRYIAPKVLDQVLSDAGKLLSAYHTANPLHAGMKAAELRQKLFRSTDRAVADAVLTELCHEGNLKKTGDTYALADFSVHFTKRQNAVRDRILKMLAEAGIEGPAVGEIADRFDASDRTNVKQVTDSLISSGEMILLPGQICCGTDAFLSACRTVCGILSEKDSMTLAEFRDAAKTSRKYALAFLEHFDKNGYTKMQDDARCRGKNYPEMELLLQ